MIKTNIGEWLSLISPKGKRIIWIDELMDLHKLDPKSYQLIKLTANKRDVAMNKKDGSTEIVELHQIKGEFSPVHKLLTQSYKDVLSEVFASATPILSWPKYNGSELLGVIPHFDLHIDRYEHKNKKYLQEINDRTMQLFELLLKQWVSKMLYINGWDYLNSDWAKWWHSATTKGTPQTNYISETESFALWLAHQTQLIKTFASELPTDVIFTPWNHDHQKLQYISDAVSLYFNKTDNVNIDNSEKDRKYYKRWDNNIWVAHWDWIKHTKVPQIMANEIKFSKHNYFLKWHIHQRLKDDLWSVLVETFPSPAHPWAWENRQWFNTRGKLYAQMYDKKHGKFWEFIK